MAMYVHKWELSVKILRGGGMWLKAILFVGKKSQKCKDKKPGSDVIYKYSNQA